MLTSACQCSLISQSDDTRLNLTCRLKRVGYLILVSQQRDDSSITVLVNSSLLAEASSGPAQPTHHSYRSAYQHVKTTVDPFPSATRTFQALSWARVSTVSSPWTSCWTGSSLVQYGWCTISNKGSGGFIWPWYGSWSRIWIWILHLVIYLFYLFLPTDLDEISVRCEHWMKWLTSGWDLDLDPDSSSGSVGIFFLKLRFSNRYLFIYSIYQFKSKS